MDYYEVEDMCDDVEAYILAKKGKKVTIDRTLGLMNRRGVSPMRYTDQVNKLMLAHIYAKANI